MGRKKVKLAFITNYAARKSCYNQRKSGLVKKVEELGTLCDLKACAVVGSSSDKNPVVWPSREKAMALYSRMDAPPDGDHSKSREISQEAFIKQQIKKTSDKAARVKAECEAQEIDIFVHKCIAGKVAIEDFDMSRKYEVSSFISQVKSDIDAMLERVHIQDQEYTDPPGPSDPSTSWPWGDDPFEFEFDDLFEI